LKAFTITTLLLFLIGIINAQDLDSRGAYFSKKEYSGDKIPEYSVSKNDLPIPLMENDKEWIAMYWTCWEIAFNHFKKPPEGSPFVSNILDEAFNSQIFQWDMIFMVMFARYGNHIFPAVNSLDNFYCRQHENGYICREISEETGEDFVFLGERKNTINPPLFSWAEVESFRNTGDMSRFKMVLPVLEKYVEWLNREGDQITADGDQWYNYGRKAANSVHGLYWNTGLGSGMDNTPRGGNGWVDMSCQMVIQYNNLAWMCDVLGDHDKAADFRTKANDIGERINHFCWSEEDGLYYDVDSAGNHVKWKTSGCFWPMLAGISSVKQCDRLVSHLQDTGSFWRQIVFPTLAADQKGYNPKGGYWKGGVWAPTNYMIIKGLEHNGFEDLANRASERYLSGMSCVFENTKTVWENYSPDTCVRGYPARPDFVGWSGIGPVALLIENVLGFRVNAVESELLWRITRTDEHGIRNLRVGDIIVSALCNERENKSDEARISVTASKPLTIVIIKGENRESFKLQTGENEIVIR